MPPWSRASLQRRYGLGNKDGDDTGAPSSPQGEMGGCALVWTIVHLRLIGADSRNKRAEIKCLPTDCGPPSQKLWGFHQQGREAQDHGWRIGVR